jgi:pimeloyl-ACP methyl ester carboxylesterase
MSEFVDSNGIKIAYDIQGSGPALVLLHGAGRTKKDWHTAGYVGRLEKDFSVVTIDLRGCGESNSAHQVEDFSIDHLTSDVQTVVEACEIETYSIWSTVWVAILADTWLRGRTRCRRWPSSVSPWTLPFILHSITSSANSSINGLIM